MQLNSNIKLRDQIIKDNCQRINDHQIHRLTPDGLQKLIDHHFVDPEQDHNLSPTIEQLLRFAENHPNLNPTFSGQETVVINDDQNVTKQHIDIDELVIDVNAINNRQDILELLEVTRNADDTIDYQKTNPNDTAIGIWWD